MRRLKPVFSTLPQIIPAKAAEDITIILRIRHVRPSALALALIIPFRHEDRRYRRPTFTRELPSMMDISMWYVVPPHKKRGVYEQEGNLYRPGCR